MYVQINVFTPNVALGKEDTNEYRRETMRGIHILKALVLPQNREDSPHFMPTFIYILIMHLNRANGLKFYRKIKVSCLIKYQIRLKDYFLSKSKTMNSTALG